MAEDPVVPRRTGASTWPTSWPGSATRIREQAGDRALLGRRGGGAHRPQAPGLRRRGGDRPRAAGPAHGHATTTGTSPPTIASRRTAAGFAARLIVWAKKVVRPFVRLYTDQPLSRQAQINQYLLHLCHNLARDVVRLQLENTALKNRCDALEGQAGRATGALRLGLVVLALRRRGQGGAAGSGAGWWPRDWPPAVTRSTVLTTTATGSASPARASCRGREPGGAGRDPRPPIARKALVAPGSAAARGQAARIEPCSSSGTDVDDRARARGAAAAVAALARWATSATAEGRLRRAGRCEPRRDGPVSSAGRGARSCGARGEAGRGEVVGCGTGSSRGVPHPRRPPAGAATLGRYVVHAGAPGGAGRLRGDGGAVPALAARERRSSPEPGAAGPGPDGAPRERTRPAAGRAARGERARGRSPGARAVLVPSRREALSRLAARAWTRPGPCW